MQWFGIYVIVLLDRRQQQTQHLAASDFDCPFLLDYLENQFFRFNSANKHKITEQTTEKIGKECLLY